MHVASRLPSSFFCRAVGAARWRGVQHCQRGPQQRSKRVGMSSTISGQGEVAPCWEVKEDLYGGVVINHAALPSTVGEFQTQLESSLKLWKAAKKRGIWLQIHRSRSEFIPVAVTKGFEFHHAEREHLMLTAWLDDSSPSTLPPNASHQVGIGAFVLNDRNEVLLVQERRGPASVQPNFFKLPTGLVDAREDISAAAVREVLEETGIVADFQAVIGFRHSHAAPFGKSDLFFSVALRSRGPQEIRIQESELAAAKWVPLDAFEAAMPHFLPGTVWAHLNALCVAWARGEYAGLEGLSLPAGLQKAEQAVYHGAGQQRGRL